MKFLCYCWDYYYDYNDISFEEKIENKKYTSETGTLSLTTGNIYVYNCYFYDMTADYGAAIYSTQTSNLLVEKCSIYSCTSIKLTAGIRVTKGNCIIAFVCSQFGYADESVVMVFYNKRMEKLCYFIRSL